MSCISDYVIYIKLTSIIYKDDTLPPQELAL